MHVPETEMGPWAAARFPTEQARDLFLSIVATRQVNEVEGTPMPAEARGALVRWRPGHFLGLNDIAYAHGGRIILPVGRRERG